MQSKKKKNQFIAGFGLIKRERKISSLKWNRKLLVLKILGMTIDNIFERFNLTKLKYYLIQICIVTRHLYAL